MRLPGMVMVDGFKARRISTSLSAANSSLHQKAHSSIIIATVETPLVVRNEAAVTRISRPFVSWIVSAVCRLMNFCKHRSGVKHPGNIAKNHTGLVFQAAKIKTVPTSPTAKYSDHEQKIERYIATNARILLLPDRLPQTKTE